MKRLFIAVAAFLIGAAAVPACGAPVGDPFFKGLKSPAELASLIDASNATDPSGASKLDAKRCAIPHDRSCARPVDYLEIFKQFDPDAGLKTASDLPAYLRSLVVKDAPKGKYWLACLKHVRGTVFRPVGHCLAREFKPDEKVWVNPKTGRPVLASDCTNPIEKPVELACPEIWIPTKNPDSIPRYAIIGPADKKPLEDGCLGVKRAGETAIERVWRDECPEVGCDFSVTTAEASAIEKRKLVVLEYGSFKTSVAGYHILYVPRELTRKGTHYSVILCLEQNPPGPEPTRAEFPTKELFAQDQAQYRRVAQAYKTWYDGTYVPWFRQWVESHSDATWVRAEHYREQGGTKEAKVYFTPAEIPAGKPKLSWHFRDWKGWLGLKKRLGPNLIP